MTIRDQITQFRIDNNIPVDGGEDDDWFIVKVGFITVKLPNPSWRKKVIHLHDIHHLLNNCDTSWKGEAYIAGWEIATGFWSVFPVCVYVFLAMAYSLFIKPLDVYRGYRDGINFTGPVKLNIDKPTIMKMELTQLKEMIEKPGKHPMRFANWLEFVFWALVSELIILVPLLLLTYGVYLILG